MSGERLMRPFIIILIFVVIGAFTLAACSSFFASAPSSSIDIKSDEMKSSLGVWTYTFYTADSGWSDQYNVTNSSVLDHWPEGMTGPMPFDSGDKEVYVVRDSEDYSPGSDKVWKQYEDYIGVKRKGDSILWGDHGGKVHRYAAPLEKFVQNFDPDTNTSRVDFSMTGKNYSLFLKLWDNNTNRIWWNNYSIYLASSIMQTNTDIFAVMGMIMTAQIPNCNPVINLMLACVVDFSIIFLAVNMILRIWSGG